MEELQDAVQVQGYNGSNSEREDSDANEPVTQEPFQVAQPAKVVPIILAGFSLTPATAVNGVIDYATATGRKLYSSATAKLEEDQFDCTPEDLYSFLKALKDRAREFGWDEPGIGILSIPNDPVSPAEFKSLIDNHGEIELETINKFERQYIDGKNRPAQDTAQLYRCLMASLSKDGKRKVLIWESQYVINGLGSGNLLLKVIIRESHLDTNATSASIRRKLTDLDKYIPTVGHDIVKFNTYVKLLVDGLRSRGERTEDLLVNLFKGYLACSDKEFVEYIKRKEDLFEDGTLIEADELMKSAAEKYKTLITKGKWNAPDANEEKILALEAEIKKLKSKKKGGNAKAKTTQRKPAWFDKRPKKSELKKPKTWNGKKWYYCHPDTGGKCDGKYRRHKPSECKGKAFRSPQKGRRNEPSTTASDGSKRKGKPNSSSQKVNKKKRMMRMNESLEAAAAVAEGDESSSQSESDSSEE